jgi:putative ABC transport system permease protein
MIAYTQFAFINRKNLGLKPEQIIAISEVPDQVTKQYTVFKNRLKEIPEISDVSACMQVPSSEIRDVGPVTIKGVQEDASMAPMMDMQIVDPDFIRMMGIELLAGDDFSGPEILKPITEFNEALTPNDYLANSPRTYIINETAMKQLGWNDPQEAIGQEINWTIGGFQLAYGPVKAVIKDFHQESLRNKVDPTIMVVEPLWLQNFLIKVQSDDVEKTLAGIEQIWNGLFPYAFEYEFLDELFNRLYMKDRIQLKLLSILAVIAMVVSFMGLISLVAYALKRRAKELAIRRVIGADLRTLTTLIGQEYFFVLIISAVIGIPISYQWVSDWLQNFAYHIKISPLIYFFSVLVVFLLLVITIYLQTFKATVDNPVSVLKED